MKVKHIFLITIFVFSLFSCKYVYIYNSYENESSNFYDDNVSIESGFHPSYDYESPYSWNFPNILKVHYRNRYYFSLKIECNKKQISNFSIDSSNLVKNGIEYPLFYPNLLRLHIDTNEIYSDGDTMWYSEQDKSFIEELLNNNSLSFIKEGKRTKRGVSLYFDIPIDYKKDESVFIKLKYLIKYEDGTEQIVDQIFGGKQIINQF